MIHQTPRPLYDGFSTPTDGTLSKKKKEKQYIHCPCALSALWDESSWNDKVEAPKNKKRMIRSLPLGDHRVERRMKEGHL